MTHADGRFVGPRPPLSILSPADVERIHETSLEMLAEVGVVFYSRARARRARRARRRRSTTRRRSPRLPPHLVERGAGHPAAHVHPRRPHAASTTCRSTASTPTSPATAAPPSCATPTARCAPRPSRTWPTPPASSRPAQPLGITSALVSAQDCPVETRVLHEFDACMRGSAKHTIVVSIKEDWEARYLIEMARAVAGGSRELYARPHVLGDPLHRQPAAPGTLRHGPRLHPGRGRHPADALPHADPRRHGAGHAGRRGGREQHRDPGRRHRRPARPPGRQDHPRRRADGALHAHRRLLRQRARGAPAARRPGPDGALLRPAGRPRLGRHQRQGAGRAVRLREHGRPAARALRRRRLPLRRRPARQRLSR